MKVDVLEHTDRRLHLKIEGTSTAVVNSLRRTLMMELPKLAIEDVTIYDNKSALFDEIVAHRLGLLSIPTDPAKFNYRDECTCEGEGCANCTVLYTLTFEGPGTVYGRDLQPATGDAEHEVAEPDVPIVKLGNDQRLMLEATAVLGTGADHAKWQPVSGATFREYPTLSLPSSLDLDPKVRDELERLAPAGAVSFNGDKLVVEDEVAAHDFLYNVASRFGIEGVEFGVEPGTYLFRFETDGSLTAKAAFQQAIAVLMDKCKGVEEQVADL